MDEQEMREWALGWLKQNNPKGGWNIDRVDREIFHKNPPGLPEPYPPAKDKFLWLRIGYWDERYTEHPPQIIPVVLDTRGLILLPGNTTAFYPYQLKGEFLGEIEPYPSPPGGSWWRVNNRR